MTQPRSPRLYTAAPNVAPETYPDNLARNNPVPNLFEEFTEVVSGELKSLTQQEFDAEYQPGYQNEYTNVTPDHPDYDGPPKPSLR